MKKIILATVLLAILVLPSCTKNWNCRCVDQSGNVSNNEINNETLLNASSKCKSENYSYTVGGATISKSCNLQ